MPNEVVDGSRNKNIGAIRSALWKVAFIATFAGLSLLTSLAQANPQSFTYQGRLYKANGTTPLTDAVNFVLQIYDPTETCLLYEEKHENYNLSPSNGLFSLSVGTAKGSSKRGSKDPNLSMVEVFANTGTQLRAPASSDCIGGYTPVAGQKRKIKVTVYNTQDLTTTVLDPMQEIVSSPYATVAETLQGKGADGFVQVTAVVTQSKLEDLVGRHAELIALTASGNYSKLQSILSSYQSGGQVTVATPSSSTDAANKGYVDSRIGGSTLDLTGLASGQSIRWDGAKWAVYTPSSAAPVTSVAGRIGAVALTKSDISGLGTASGKDVASSGNASVTQVVLGSDTRLTDARVPDGNAGGDLSGAYPNPTVAKLRGSEVSDLSSLGAGDAGKVLKWDGTNWEADTDSGGGSGSVSDASTTAKGIVQLATSSDTTASLVVQASDTRLSDSRAPSGSAAGAGSDLAGTYPSPTVAKIRGNGVTAGTLTSTDAGKVYRWSGTSFEASYLNFGDLVNARGADQFSGRCTSGQTLYYNSLTDVFECANISITASQVSNFNTAADARITAEKGQASGLASLDSGSRVPASQLPVADGSTAGIVSTIAQSFAGVKTFINNVVMQGTLTVAGDATLNGTVTIVNGVKLGSGATTCDSGSEGMVRYNSTSKQMEFCNGTAWGNFSSGTVASVTIGPPSVSLVKSGPVTFTVTYGSSTDAPTINLSAAKITLGGTATTGCSVASVAGSGMTRTVTVDGCTGTGTVSISVAAGTAFSTSGEAAFSAGPSDTYQVDNTGPSAPSGVTLGSVPLNLSNSPTITYSASTDSGGSTVASYQAKVIKTSDSSVVQDWVNHTPGNDVASLSLSVSTQYSVLVRAVDAVGNQGAASGAVSWTTPASVDCNIGSPIPGAVCIGGAIYLGILSPGSTSGSGTDRYMTTPGGCGEIPAGQIVGSGTNAYPNADFTPTCSGTDGLAKTWNDGGSGWYSIPTMTSFGGSFGTGYGATNTDDKYGSQNTAILVAITDTAQGGYHAAARYCDKLNFGGYTDWFLPNRYELNLFWTNKNAIPGLNTADWYWSSTSRSSADAWRQQFSDGNQNGNVVRSAAHFVRCVRKF